MPGFSLGALDSDLLDLEIGGGAGFRRHTNETASLHTSQSQQSVFSHVGLQLPDSSSVDLGGDGFMLPGSGSVGQRPSNLLSREELDVLLPDIDIGLDDEGNFIELGEASRTQQVRSGLILPSEVASGTAHGEGLHFGAGGDTALQDDYFPPIDDGYDLPPPEVRISLPDKDHAQPEQEESMVDSSSTVAAQQRRKKRAPKVIPLDRSIELRNRDLLNMSNNYMDRMIEDWKRITTGKNTAQARKNADVWLLGRGIGNVGIPLVPGGIQGPLAEMWSGDNLYRMLTGKEHGTKGKKRESEDEVSTPERRVRPRVEEDMAPQFEFGDDTIMRDYELEVGREGQEPLEDVSQAMPWNVSASIRGSSVARTAAGASGVPGSLPGSISRLGSRMVSASPLLGRGFPSEAADGLTSDPIPFMDYGEAINTDAFELYGPGAGVDTQTAVESQWQKAALDRESNNFLDFIGNAIEENRAAGEEGEMLNEVELEALLPPAANSRTVAAQALLHVLTLGTKNLLKVTQKEPFAAITLQAI